MSADHSRAPHLVAAATRMLAVAGIFDMHGHISLRDGDSVFVNGHGASRIAVRPDEIAVVRVLRPEHWRGSHMAQQDIEGPVLLPVVTSHR